MLSKWGLVPPYLYRHYGLGETLHFLSVIQDRTLVDDEGQESVVRRAFNQVDEEGQPSVDVNTY